MTNCFDCGKKFGWRDSKNELKNLAKKLDIQDEVANKMNDKDRICSDCNVKFQIRHALEVWKYYKKTMTTKEHEDWKKNVDGRVFDEAQRLLRKENSDIETTTNFPTDGIFDKIYYCFFPKPCKRCGRSSYRTPREDGMCITCYHYTLNHPNVNKITRGKKTTYDKDGKLKNE